MTGQLFFRGQDITKKWHYGALLEKKGILHILTNVREINCGTKEEKEYVSDHIINPYTAGLWSGIADAHFTRIFDGDIIDLEYPNGRKQRFLVSYDAYSGGAFYLINYDGKQQKPILMKNEFIKRCNGKVVGNMFDNQKLLKEQVK